MKRKIKFVFYIVLIMMTISSVFAGEIEDNLTKHLSFLTDSELKGHKTGSQENKIVANYIYNQFNLIGLETEIESFSKEQQNVIGRIPGKTDKYIVIGANYDGIGKRLGKVYTSVDSNASGVAVLIELARLLKQEELEYGIEFIAFDGGQKNMSGSYSQRKKINSKNNDYVLMLNLHNLGHLKDEGRLIFEGVETIKNGEKYIRETIVDNIGIRTYPTRIDNGYYGDSFNYSKKNIPSMDITTGYETSSIEDKLEDIDITGMEVIVKQINMFVINIQGKIEPTGTLLFEKAEMFCGLEEQRQDELWRLGLFLNIPTTFFLGGSNIGVQPEVFYNLKIIELDEKVRINCIQVELPIVIEGLINNVLFLQGIFGPYYSNYINSKKSIYQEIGFVYGIELGYKNFSSLLDGFGLKLDLYTGIINFPKEKKYNFEKPILEPTFSLIFYF